MWFIFEPQHSIAHALVWAQVVVKRFISLHDVIKMTQTETCYVFSGTLVGPSQSKPRQTRWRFGAWTGDFTIWMLSVFIR